MQTNTAFQDAIARAKQIAEKLSAAAPNAALKRPNSDDEQSAKRPSFGSPSQTGDVASPVLRAQLVAQQINSQLGVKTTGDSLPLSNQLTFQEEYKIPDKFVGLIIGKGGEQITRLQADSSCKVQIMPLRTDATAGGPNPPDRIANLCGSREAIERVRRMMDDIIARGRMSEQGGSGVNPYSMGGLNSRNIEVMLPSAKCGLVIGKGGENIRRVSEEFGIKMYVGQETSMIDGIEHKPLKIMGDPDKVERAKQHVLDSLSRSGPPNSANRFNPNQGPNASYNDYGSRSDGGSTSGPCNEATYLVPYEKAGIIIGKGGETIKEINRRSGAHVELDKTHMPNISNLSERLFKLRGTPDQIVAAQQLMYERVANGPGGAGEILTPIQFQQQFNLPLVGSKPADSWSNNHDPYGADPNSAATGDPYSQWMAAYGQWPGMNPYDTSGSGSAGKGDAAAAMAQMDPAWLAYYQSMNYYSMMQANMAATSTATSTTTTKPTDTTAANSSSTSTNTGQADYSQQWIEYYRSMGQNELADEIERQLKEGRSTSGNSNSSSAANPWAAYAQQWASNGNGTGTAANTTSNGTTNSSTAASS